MAADFPNSSHRARWIFPDQWQLEEKRSGANRNAADMLAEFGTTRLMVAVDGSVSYPKPLHERESNDVDRHSHAKPLDCKDEQLMRVFYEQKIQEVCAAFQFPHKIQATAILYFKRFYLKWSVMQHHPKHIMLTCVYASCKIEENHVSAEELGKGIQQDHQMILNNEMLVFQTLGFDLIVYSPYRSLEGFVEDIKEFCQIRDSEEEQLKDLRESAILETDRIMLTDVPLLFSPGQLALAALHRSNEVHRVIDFERYLDSLLSRQRASYSVDQYVQLLMAIDQFVSQLKLPDSKDMRHIDRKLKSCLDPTAHEDHKKEKKSKHRKRTASEALEKDF